MYLDYCKRHDKKRMYELSSVLSSLELEFDSSLFELLMKVGAKSEAISYVVNKITDIHMAYELFSRFTDDKIKGEFLEELYDKDPSVLNALKGESEQTKISFWKCFSRFVGDKEIARKATETFPESVCTGNQIRLMLDEENEIPVKEVISFLYKWKDDLTSEFYLIDDYIYRQKGKIEEDNECLRELVEIENKISKDDGDFYYQKVWYLKHPDACFKDFEKNRYINPLDHRFQFCPGECEEPGAQVMPFSEWMAEFQRQCEENKKEKIYYQVGKLLAYSKDDKDGLPLHKEVRDYLEETDDVKDCFMTSEMDKHSFYVLNDDSSQHELAEDYAKKARKLMEEGYNQVAEIYYRISGYFRHEAEDFRMRMENDER